MKNLKKMVPLSELQSQISALVNQVRKTGQAVHITVNGREAAVLVDPDFYQGTVVTREEKAFPDWKRRLTRAEKELESGKMTPLKALKMNAKKDRA